MNTSKKLSGFNIEIWDYSPKNTRTLLFIHGFPDDSSLWNEQVEYFKKDYRCLCIDLPNFGDSIIRKKGFDFNEIIELIERRLQNLEYPLTGKITLIIHDWGAIYGYLYTEKFPERVEKVVALDVGVSLGKQENPLGYLLMPLYQWGLTGTFLISQIPTYGERIGRILSHIILSTLIAATSIFEKKKLAGPKRRTKYSPLQNYPYYYYWKNLLFGKTKLIVSTPNVPFLFIYGKLGMKRFMNFHDKKWLLKIKQSTQNQVQEFENSGHWLNLDETDRFNKTVDKFLNQ